MAFHRKLSRRLLVVLTVAVLAAALTAAFWPQPMRVDIATITTGDLKVTIDEEGRTRVRDTYVLSTPVTGRLLRVQAQPGDTVVGGETLVAQMRPTNPSALDVRTREQARAAVDAAEAALQVAQADLNAATAADDYAQSELARTQHLYEMDIVARAALDRAQSEARTASATRETAEAAISMREAQLTNAQAQLINFEDPSIAAAIDDQPDDAIPLFAPIDGRILQIMQESETILPAGSPVMEIGDIAGDLEVLIDLTSSDAVQVSVGDPVELLDWGGPDVLMGRVARINPFGETKYSALGVEEQRVGVVVDLLSPAEDRDGLGHEYRIEAKIIIWEGNDLVLAPASALFRENGDWALFAVDAEGMARVTPVQIGRSDGVMTEVTSGIAAGTQVVVYPAAGLTDGTAVTSRD